MTETYLCKRCETEVEGMVIPTDMTIRFVPVDGNVPREMNYCDDCKDDFLEWYDDPDA